MAFAVMSRHYPLERRSCFNSPNRAGSIDRFGTIICYQNIKIVCYHYPHQAIALL
ncbi:hypothetical protein [Chroococcidiopsis sp. SAG 2025]|uniref:hypothetical protein n=1 Tax=Chroococcidiopsis sp. SAG 2025 TaxID=171389 RepID=UPI002937205A|nr:hypothetical protein [Chroococcidiopsis sp. SAG 2025]